MLFASNELNIFERFVHKCHGDSNREKSALHQAVGMRGRVFTLGVRLRGDGRSEEMIRFGWFGGNVHP